MRKTSAWYGGHVCLFSIIFSPSLKIRMRSLKAACTKYCEPHLNLARHSIMYTAQNETFAGTSQSVRRLDCGCWIPSRVKRCKFFQGVLTGSEVYMPPNQWLQEYIFVSIKRLEREADHSPICSAEVMNACCYPSTHPIWIYGVEPNTEMYVFLLTWNYGMKVKLKLCICVRFSRWYNRTILNNFVDVSHHIMRSNQFDKYKITFRGQDRLHVFTLSSKT
jgi:hypothetical protein